MIQSGSAQIPEDKVSIILSFGDGSVGSINYFSNGPSRGYPKETLDIFCGGRALKGEDFRTTIGWGWPSFRRFRTRHQEKGQVQGCRMFLEAIEHGLESPTPLVTLIDSAVASLGAVRSAAENRSIDLDREFPRIPGLFGSRR